MKTKTLIITSLLVVSLLLAGCGSKEPTETTVNLPVVNSETQNTAVPTLETTIESPAVTYPVDQNTDPAVSQLELAYPVGDDSSASYATEMRAYIEQILGGTIDIEELFGKDDEELIVILRNAALGRIDVTETGLERAADWLKKQ
jgi:PBP1b-binding outer membrane lipoprotein LpoB